MQLIRVAHDSGNISTCYTLFKILRQTLKLFSENNKPSLSSYSSKKQLNKHRLAVLSSRFTHCERFGRISAKRKGCSKDHFIQLCHFVLLVESRISFFLLLAFAALSQIIRKTLIPCCLFRLVKFWQSLFSSAHYRMKIFLHNANFCLFPLPKLVLCLNESSKVKF